MKKQIFSGGWLSYCTPRFIAVVLDLFFWTSVFSQGNSQVSINALSFDGVNDYVSIGYVNYFFGTGDFTVEARFRDQAPAGGNSEEVIISSQSSSATNGFLIEILNGHLTTFLGGNSFTCNTADLRDNSCHHFAMTRQAGVVKHYLDGVLLSPMFNSLDNVDSPDPILIGIKRISGGLAGSFKGLLKEVRIWGGARSQQQIQFNINVVPFADINLELLGYWRFDEGIGQIINCCLGNVSPGGFLGNSSAAEISDPTWAIGCPSCLPPNVFITSSASVLCPANSVTLTANTDPNMSFQWTLNGSNITGATSSSYIAMVGGNYTVLVTGTCGSSSAGFILNTGALPSATISTSSATTFCAGGSAFLSANTGNGLSYQWRRDGVTINGATASSFVASSSGAYTCKVSNVCGSTISNSININAIQVPALPGIISGPSSVCKRQTKTYSISPVAGATSYTWTVPSGAHILSGQGTTSISVRFGNNGGNISVKASNSCGVGLVRSLVVTMNCRETSSSENTVVVTVYPNPSSGQFTFKFDENLEGIIRLDIKDLTGKQIEVIENIQAGSEISVGENWSEGIYFVMISSDSISEVKKLVKQD